MAQKDFSLEDIKVLLVTTGYPPDFSSSGKRLHLMLTRMTTRFSDFGWRVLTMSSHNSNDRFEGIEIKRIRHIQPLGFLSKSARFNVPIDAFYGIIASIAYFMSIREKVDIVHTSGWSWNVFAASLWARINGIPLFLRGEQIL